MAFSDWFKAINLIDVLQIHPDDIELINQYDIKWGNNFTEKLLKKVEMQDNIAKITCFELRKEDGLSDEEAMKAVRKILPFYYGKLKDRNNGCDFTDEDSMLPFILKGRINKATTMMKISKSDIQHASSKNALIRNMIRTGRI